MKIFQIIKDFTRKLTKKVRELITPNNKPSQTVSHVNQPIRKKKRKSFHSFIRDGQYSSSSSYIAKKRPLRRNNHFVVPRQKKSNHSLSNILKPFAPPTPQIPFNSQGQPIFIDNDGLEISEILSNSQHSSSVQSDSEILKFIYGQDKPTKQPVRTKTTGTVPESALAENHIKENLYIIKSKSQEWWKDVLEISEKQIDSKLNQGFSEIAEEADSEGDSQRVQVQTSSKSKYKRKLIRHAQKPRTLRQASIKVLNIIDLVQNEDQPKLFQLPLKRNHTQ